MLTLALETTSSHGSVALLQDETVIAAAALEDRHYGTAVFAATDRLLRTAGMELRGVDLFAVADGPGSFTGVRIGLTVVKGWIEVLGKPAAPVSTLRAVAGPGSDAVLAILDASRSEVYRGWYPHGTLSRGAGKGEETLESRAQLAVGAAPAGARAITPDANLKTMCPWLELGEALLAPAVGRLGLADFQNGLARNALGLDARYIRRSDAELIRTPQPA